MELANQIVNVNLDVRVDNMEYVNMDDVGVILHHLQRFLKHLMELAHQIVNVNLDVRVGNMEYVITDDVGVILHHLQRLKNYLMLVF
jgi:hypothetical protein